MNDTNNFDPGDGASASATTVGKTSGLAIAALVLGIPGLCITPLGIIALILGIIALIQIADPQRQLVGKGMAVVGTVLGGLSILIVPVMLVAILLPALGAARSAAMSMKDATNIRHIGLAMISYAVDNNNNVLPDHPRDAVPYLGNAVQAQDIFISPHHDPTTVLERGDSDGVAVRYGSYVFLLPGVSLDDIDSPSDTVLAYTAKDSDPPLRRAVLFADGHAELMEEQDFRALLPSEVDVDALDGP